MFAANDELVSWDAVALFLAVLYTYHTFRAPEQTKVQLEDANLKPLIAEIFEKSGCRFGARKIRAKLIQAGHTASERRILRLMKELGVAVKVKHPKLNSANDRQ